MVIAACFQKKATQVQNTGRLGHLEFNRLHWLIIHHNTDLVSRLLWVRQSWKEKKIDDNDKSTELGNLTSHQRSINVRFWGDHMPLLHCCTGFRCCWEWARTTKPASRICEWWRPRPWWLGANSKEAENGQGADKRDDKCQSQGTRVTQSREQGEYYYILVDELR